jgi:tetratricopeptide (TPR) repeat protein
VALLEGRYDSAEGYFRAAYEMDRSYDEALVNLGLLRELQGRSSEARAIYLKYLEKSPSSGNARNNLAALEYDGGRGTMETVASLEKAIVLSDQVVIRDNLVVLRSK